jgi:hypothetical protein
MSWYVTGMDPQILFLGAMLIGLPYMYEGSPPVKEDEMTLLIERYMNDELDSFEFVLAAEEL